MSSKKSSSLMTSILRGASAVVGKVSYVVRHDRICAGSECAQATTCRSFVVGENDRTLKALTQPETDASSNALFIQTKR
jgi:hypothetical protein